MIKIQIPDRPGQIEFSHAGTCMERPQKEQKRFTAGRYINSMGLFADIKLGEERTKVYLIDVSNKSL